MITLTDVAKAAGVSVATASMVLNPGHKECRVSRQRVERVRAAAQSLGYVGNYHARAMQMGKAETIGLALDFGSAGRSESPISAMGGVYFNKLTAGVETQTHFVGYNLVLIGPSHDERAVDRGVKQLLQRRLDGLVVAAVLSSVRSSRLLAEQQKLPVVLVEHDGESEFPVVTYDEAAGVNAAVRHLAELGHRELLWLGPEGARREQLFIQAAWDAGLRGTSCRFAPPPPHGNRDVYADAAQLALAQHHAEKRSAFSAVMCYNDATAIGAYGALLGAGLRIPHDVSVVGFDDIHAAHVYPRMTTVSHLLHEMGLRAAELALEMADSSEAIERLRRHREVLTPELVVRDSTAPARRSETSSTR